MQPSPFPNHNALLPLSRGRKQAKVRDAHPRERYSGPKPTCVKGWVLAGLAVAGIWQLVIGASTAYAHGGVAPGDNLWLAWNTSNPLPTLFLFVAAYLYINGLGKREHPSHPVSIWHRISFFSGLFVIFLALQSPIDPLAEHYFFIHQVQHLMIRMLGPLLVLLGAPLTPMLRGLPLWALQGGVRAAVRQNWVRGAYHRLTNPAVAVGIFMGALYIWQIPFLHDTAVRNDYVHEVMHASMLFSGFLFWWLVIDPKPHRSRLHYGLRVLYLGLIVLPNTVLGAGHNLLQGSVVSVLHRGGKTLDAERHNRSATGWSLPLGSRRHDEHRGRRHSYDNVVPAGTGKGPTGGRPEKRSGSPIMVKRYLKIRATGHPHPKERLNK